ncbi:MAG: lipid-A-disaccharide synthase, partial [Gammaproteobacteria bacterium]|nr:lipid-A-disaccharide synthase [Gammaproteobacteria bacterium]
EARKIQFLNFLAEQTQSLPIQVVVGQAQQVMAASDAVLLASGTATLEAMLLKKPMVVAYRWGAVSHAIISRMFKAPFIALPNLLVGQELVPELLQEQVTPERLAAALFHVLEDSSQQILVDKFTEIHKVLRRNGDELAAEAILKLIGRI